MAYEDYELLEYPEFIKRIEDFFKKSEEKKLSAIKIYSDFCKKYPEMNNVFNLALDVKISIAQILDFMDAVKKLSQHYKEIEAQTFDLSLPKQFNQLADKADEFWKYHRRAFKKNLGMWEVMEEIPKKDKKIIEEKLYGELSDYIDYERNELWRIAPVLAKHVRDSKGTLNTPINNTEGGYKKPGDKKIEIKLKNGKLTIKENTGFVKLNNTEGTFNPKSNEFKTLLILVKNKNLQATYQELLGEENVSKTTKRNLTFTIRNIKETLGILPRKKKNKNKDIIKNLKLYGYKLIV